MQSTRLNALSSSSGGGINGGSQRSSSPSKPENPKFSPSTIITPSSPSRFIGPLQYVDPVYIRRVDSILRSFPTDANPTEVYTALKAHLGISRSKDPAPPPPTEGLPRPSDPPVRRKETELNLSSTIEGDSIPRRTCRQAMNKLLLEAEGSRQQWMRRKIKGPEQPQKQARLWRGQGARGRRKEVSFLPQEGHHSNQGSEEDINVLSMLLRAKEKKNKKPRRRSSDACKRHEGNKEGL